MIRPSKPPRDGFQRHGLPASPTAPLFPGLIGALCLIFNAALARAEPAPYTGSIEACLSDHGSRERYLAGLMSGGWRDVPPDQREGALRMLADAYLPVTGTIDGTWADHLANRGAALAFWADLARNRTILSRGGVVLLLAGFRDDNATMRVECWTAGPQNPVTDDLFALIGAVYQSEGVSMTQVNLPATDTRPATELFVSRLDPAFPADPPLAATDGLRSRIVFAMPGTAP